MRLSDKSDLIYQQKLNILYYSWYMNSHKWWLFREKTTWDQQIAIGGPYAGRWRDKTAEAERAPYCGRRIQRVFAKLLVESQWILKSNLKL